MDAERAAPAVADQHTLALVNTYVVSMAPMLNDFSVGCERQLRQVQTSLQAAEAKLSILEAQLEGVVAAAPGSRDGNSGAVAALEASNSGAATEPAELDLQLQNTAALGSHGGSKVAAAQEGSGPATTAVLNAQLQDAADSGDQGSEAGAERQGADVEQFRGEAVHGGTVASPAGDSH